jgi:hypothetical protein
MLSAEQGFLDRTNPSISPTFLYITTSSKKQRERFDMANMDRSD